MRRFIAMVGFVVGLLAAGLAHAAASWTCSPTTSWGVASGYMIAGQCVASSTYVTGGDIPLAPGLCGSTAKVLVQASTTAAMASGGTDGVAITVDVATGKVQALCTGGADTAVLHQCANATSLAGFIFHYLAFCR